MKDITKNVLQQIEKEGITPESKTKVKLKNFGRWILYFANIIFGSITFAVIIYYFASIEWDALSEVDLDGIHLVYELFPYFWASSFTLLAVGSYYSFINTPKGYRTHVPLIFLVNILSSMVIGFIIFHTQILSNVDEHIEDYSKPEFVQLKPKRISRENIWEQKNRNIIKGKILEIDEEEEIIVINTKNKGEVIVKYNDAIIGDIGFEEGEIIGVIGKRERGEDLVIYAKFIKPIDIDSLKRQKYLQMNFKKKARMELRIKNKNNKRITK